MRLMNSTKKCNRVMNSSTNKLSNKISWFFKLESNSHKEINYVYGVKQSEISITRHHFVLSLRQKTHTRWNTTDQIRTWWEHFAITRPLGTRVSCNCLIWLIQINRHLFNDNKKKTTERSNLVDLNLTGKFQQCICVTSITLH